MGWWIYLLFMIISVSASITTVSANERTVLDLEQCIKRAIEVSPEVAEASYEVERFEAKRQQAEGAYYPQVEVLAITAPSPRARGDQVSSPDDSTDPVISGIFGRSEITLIQPLYTFGKLSNLREAAERGIKTTRAARDKTISDIILRTKHLYYTIQLSKNMRNHILDIKEIITEALDKVKKRLEKNLPTADIIDKYKLMTFLGIVETKLNEVEKNLAIAKDALKTMVGIHEDVEFDVIDEPFLPLSSAPISLEEGIKNARQMRPEFIQLREGIEARKALVKAERGNYYPVFFMGFKGSLASASNRDRLHNPFVFDEFNHSYASIFLGLKWTFDFGITRGRIMEAEAELKKLFEKKRFADKGIPFQVRKAYSDIEEAKRSVQTTESAYKNAKRWLVVATSNFDMGVGEAKDVADAIEMYALTRADYLKAVYNERLSIANLYHVTGMDLKEMEE
jgi:outer membrane protein TolC